MDDKKIERVIAAHKKDMRRAAAHPNNTAYENRIAELEDEIKEADKYNTSLQDEVRSLKNKVERMHTYIDQLNSTLTARTTALCALLGLSDPK